MVGRSKSSVEDEVTAKELHSEENCVNIQISPPSTLPAVEESQNNGTLSPARSVSLHDNNEFHPQTSATNTANNIPTTVNNDAGQESQSTTQRKLSCVKCPMSLSSFFVGLGRLVTGYNLTLVLSNLSTFPKCGDSMEESSVTTIPFENLDESSSTNPTTTYNVAESINNGSTLIKSSPIHVTFKLPIFIFLVSIFQWVFFYFVMNGEYAGWMSDNLEFNPLKRYEVWRFFTAIFIHSSKAHLWGNLRSQIITGCCLEVVHGWKRVSILYVCSAFFSNLTTSAMEPFLRAYGASGAAYALITAHLASIIMNWNNMWGAFNRCFLIMIYLILSVAAAINPQVTESSARHILPAHHMIGHAAHFGGALAGFLIGFFVLETFQRKPWKVKMARVCQYVIIVLFILGIGANIGDQIFYWKSVENHRRNLLLQSQLQNHTGSNNSVLFHNTSKLSSFYSKSTSAGTVFLV